ncbi:histidine kinase [Thalassoporum mexicanum PCC 7367]|uniref:PAS domain-containing sensor histidine kinase n=1 Tax=Thalassoporum mexicanum TaxID=3457544 RepID=UPI00029FB954|nr:PAS domain-containing sensor histidine kinase [Pseudanabaena sp. PCC 7367]AFY71208.1 histidine kinase [Pseudanabaena sp. PCC 7367]
MALVWFGLGFGSCLVWVIALRVWARRLHSNNRLKNSRKGWRSIARLFSDRHSSSADFGDLNGLSEQPLSPLATLTLAWQLDQINNNEQVAPPVDRKTSHLQAQQNNWQQIINQVPLGYIQVDEENRLVFCNHPACGLLGIPNCLESATNRRFLLQLVRSYELDQLIQKTRDDRQNHNAEWVFHWVEPDPLNPHQRQDIPLQGYSFPLADGHIGIFIQDCTEKVTLIQQRDRWASDVAHELKTPLTSIRLVAETLQARIEPDLRIWIDRLLDEILRLSNLVQDLLDLGQTDIGMPLKLNIQTIDLVQLIKSAWSSLEPLAQKQRVRLEYQGIEQIELEADQSRIFRLFLNLLDNAIKYSPALQIILVVVELVETDQQVLIQVIDSGPGFPAESLPHVFDRFYRVDQSRARHMNEKGGSGLGLAIARQIVQTHHGKITVSNDPDTGGACIEVRLPLHHASNVLTQNSLN